MSRQTFAQPAHTAHRSEHRILPISAAPTNEVCPENLGSCLEVFVVPLPMCLPIACAVLCPLFGGPGCSPGSGSLSRCHFDFFAAHAALIFSFASSECLRPSALLLPFEAAESFALCCSVFGLGRPRLADEIFSRACSVCLYPTGPSPPSVRFRQTRAVLHCAKIVFSVASASASDGQEATISKTASELYFRSEQYRGLPPRRARLRWITHRFSGQFAFPT